MFILCKLRKPILGGAKGLCSQEFSCCPAVVTGMLGTYHTVQV